MQLTRLMARDQCTKQAAEQRIAAQMKLSEKKRLADIIIDNSSSLNHLKSQVKSVYTAHLGPGIVYHVLSLFTYFFPALVMYLFLSGCQYLRL